MNKEIKSRIGSQPIPVAAYHLEGQPVVVAQMQHECKLESQKVRFERIEARMEMGLVWFELHYYEFPDYHHTAVLFSVECDLELINSLKEGDPLKIVAHRKEVRPDVCFGRPDYVVAAIFSGQEILYQSPGFDLEEWEKLTTD